jgi:hypothetical protein
MLVHGAVTFLAALGTLQAAALHNGLEGLAWPVGTRRRRSGYLLAGLLLAVAFVARLLTASSGRQLAAELIVPSIAAGAGLALVVTIIGAAARLHLGSGRRRLALPGQPIPLGPLESTYYRPGRSAPYPALCLVPDPTAPGDDVTALVQALLERGIAVLHLGADLREGDRLALQGLVAMGVSHLVQWSEVDSARIGLAGVGLGGDLALRGAAADPGVAAALAIEPVLTPGRPGMGLEALRAASWFTARRRTHRWRRSRLALELDALEAAVTIAPRPVAIMVGSGGTDTREQGVSIVRVQGSCALLPASHPETVRRAAGWMEEHLS